MENIEVITAKGAFSFMMGCGGYSIIEILYRGYSHPVMSVVGGVCGVMIYFLSISRLNYAFSVILSGFGITLIELLTGIVSNLMLGLAIWDYSELKYNFLGQISVKYSLMWLILSAIFIPLCQYMDKKFFFYKKI